MSVQTHTMQLISAAETGDASEIERLIPISNPKAYNSQALWTAACSGHPKCVELLLPVSDVDASVALHVSVIEQEMECFVLILPFAGLTSRNNALQTAVMEGHHHFVELLFDVCDHEQVLTQLRLKHNNEPEKWNVLVDLYNQRQGQRIAGALRGEGTPSVKRKM